MLFKGLFINLSCLDLIVFKLQTMVEQIFFGFVVFICSKPAVVHEISFT